MAVVFSKVLLGEMCIEQPSGQRFKIQIRKGNCLAVFIHVRKDVTTLYSFFADIWHMKNIMKSNDGKLFWDKIISVKLNLKHKQSVTLAKYMAMCGYKVTCYYKEED